MGGFSAIDLAMRYPDIFTAAYGMSPALFDRHGLEDSMMFDSEGKQLTQLHKLQELGNLPTDEDVREMIHFDGPLGFTVAYGAAFAPNPDLGPPYFDYPVEEEDGAAVRIPTTSYAVVLLLVNLDLIGLVVLTLLLSRNLIKAYFERRHRLVGAGFRTKLIARSSDSH